MKYYIDNSDCLQLIIKICGKLCNLACAYCYEQVREYESSQFIDMSTLRKALDLFKCYPLSVQLHGGEPLICGMDLMKEILNCLKEYSNIRSVNIQTNGTLLNKSWLDMFNEVLPSIEIGISSDGDPEANIYRKDKEGNTVYGLIENAFTSCSMNGRDVGVIAVVNRSSLYRPKAILDYFSHYPAIKIINFTPCYDLKIIDIPVLDNYVITLKEYNEFIKEIFDIWLESGYYTRFFIDPVYSIISKLLGKQVSLCHFNQYKCGHIFTLFPGGILRSCDEISECYSSYGNVNDFTSFNDILDVKSRNHLIYDLYKLNKRCLECNVAHICGGGCMSTRRHFALLNREDDYCKQRIDLIAYFEKKFTI